MLMSGRGEHEVRPAIGSSATIRNASAERSRLVMSLSTGHFVWEAARSSNDGIAERRAWLGMKPAVVNWTNRAGDRRLCDLDSGNEKTPRVRLGVLVRTGGLDVRSIPGWVPQRLPSGPRPSRRCRDSAACARCGTSGPRRPPFRWPLRGRSEPGRRPS